jgi:hypothetical protein
MSVANRRLISGVGASKRVLAAGIVATFAVLFVAGGCDRGQTPPAEEVVAAADIASCRTEGDEATAQLVEGMEGTVLALGDEAYPRGSIANFEECYGPSWGGSRSVPGLSQATTSTTPKGLVATSSTSVRPQEIPRKATTPTSSGPGPW